MFVDVVYSYKNSIGSKHDIFNDLTSAQCSPWGES